MTLDEKQIEQELETYRKSLTPSHSLARRVINSVIVEKEQTFQGRSVPNIVRTYSENMKKIFSVIVPIAAIAVVVFLFAPKNVTETNIANANFADAVVNEMINNELFEQAIIDEADNDGVFALSDTNQLDAIVSIYNANEY